MKESMFLFIEMANIEMFSQIIMGGVNAKCMQQKKIVAIIYSE